MKTDYSCLEGRVIDWYNDGLYYRGLVVLCDYSLGITIVNKEDKKDNLTCINGPSSPNTVERDHISRVYDEIFFKTVAMISRGVYIGEEGINENTTSRGYGVMFEYMAGCPTGL